MAPARPVHLLSAAAALFCAAAFLGSTPHAAAESCDGGDARVFNDPVELLTVVPPSGAVELAGASGGRVRILSAGAPRIVSLARPDGLRQFTAVAVRFVFPGAKTKATISVEIERTLADDGYLFSVEEVARPCLTPDTTIVDIGRSLVRVQPGVRTSIAQIPEDVPGTTRVDLEGTFPKGVVHQLVIYRQKDKGNDVDTQLVNVFVDAEDGVVVPDAALKLQPIGADATTGCPGTDLSNLTEAIRLESLVRLHVANVDAAFDPSNLKTPNAPQKSDFDTVRTLLEASKEHLSCARKLVLARQDLPEPRVTAAVADIDEALADDDAALAALTAPVDGVKNRSVREMAQLRAASVALSTTVGRKVDAAREIDPNYAEQALAPVYDSNAPLADKVTRYEELVNSFEMKLDAFSDTVVAMKLRVKQNGQDGLAQVLASNQNRECLRFLEKTILADLREMVVLMQPAGTKPDVTKEKRKAVQNLVKESGRSAAAVESATSRGDARLVEQPAPPPKRSFQKARERDLDFLIKRAGKGRKLRDKVKDDQTLLGRDD